MGTMDLNQIVDEVMKSSHFVWIFQNAFLKVWRQGFQNHSYCEMTFFITMFSYTAKFNKITLNGCDVYEEKTVAHSCQFLFHCIKGIQSSNKHLYVFTPVWQCWQSVVWKGESSSSSLLTHQLLLITGVKMMVLGAFSFTVSKWHNHGVLQL